MSKEKSYLISLLNDREPGHQASLRGACFASLAAGCAISKTGLLRRFAARNDSRKIAYKVAVNWTKLLRISTYSKTNQLLFSKVKGSRQELNMPQAEYSELEKDSRINLIRNTLLLQEFEDLCSLLSKEEVDVVLLKGIFLLRTIYQKQIALRRMEDVDILIKEQDFNKADSFLRAHGYQVLADDKLGRKTAMYFKYNQDGSTLMPVHLHWHIANISQAVLEQSCNSIDIKEIWSNANLLDAAKSKNVFIMRPEHSLLALSEHGLRHGFSGLMFLYDIHQVITQNAPSLDWEFLQNRAKGWGLAVPLFLGLTLSQKIFSTEVPGGFLQKLRPKGMSLLERFFLGYNLSSDFPKEEACGIIYLAMNRRLVDKIRFLRALRRRG